MSSAVNIPIIARGQIIMPADGDTVEFRGRGGSSFLAEVAKLLRLEDNQFLQESFALALQAGGLVGPSLRSVYDNLPAMFLGAMTINHRQIGGSGENARPW